MKFIEKKEYKSRETLRIKDEFLQQYKTACMKMIDTLKAKNKELKEQNQCLILVNTTLPHLCNTGIIISPNEAD